MSTAIFELLATNLAIILSLMVLMWMVSLAIGDVSFIDGVWGLGFVVLGWATAFQAGATDRVDIILLMLVTIWGLRLSGYLFWRWWRAGPDPRYQRILARSRIDPRLFSLIYVFLLQGILLWIIAAPVQLGQIGQSGEFSRWLIGVGTGLWLIGLIFESVGDAQLARFKADPANKGRVLDTGLWRYTRHPNYFGDACVWWGIYLVAAGTPLGVWTVFSPLLMTFLLLKWSGVPLLERQMQTTRPAYGDYARRTSAFFPLPPKDH